MLRRIVVSMFSIGLMMLGAGIVSGQEFPSKPMRIVTAEVGGGQDVAARLMAQGLTVSLGQQMIVDNRPALISIDAVAKAPPDGYTLLLVANPLWILPLFQKTSYDPVKDFSAITLLAMAPNVLVVHPSLPVKSAKELIALAKAKPGALNLASTTLGGASWFAAELFKSMAGVNIVAIQYRGAGPALNDLLGGHVQLMFATSGSVAPHVKSGRLRAIAVTSGQRSALLPGLPTVAASGLPGYEAGVVYGMFAPAKTPDAIVRRLNQEIVRVLNQGDVKERFFNSGSEIVGSSPEQLAAAMKSEMDKVSNLIKITGIRLE